MRVYDLYCGLGGWSEGFLSEGYECVGFDIEAHDYGTGGYPGKLIIRDVRSIHGSEMKDATCIVASPPCQAYSYRAMPWKRAKALPPPDNTLFNECFRIQREASVAAGHYIPMVVENVRGAQPWVGRARANFGSFYLWGDVGMIGRRVVCIRNGVPVGYGVAPIQEGRKHDGSGWTEKGSLLSHNRLVANTGVKHGSSPGKVWSDRPPCISAHREATKIPGNNSPRRWEDREIKRLGDATKVPGICLSKVGFNVAAAQRYREATKQQGSGAVWFDTGIAKHSSRSDSRKAASAMIAKIPFSLAQYVAECFKETA